MKLEVGSLAHALQRFVVEQIRDTRLGVLGRQAPHTLARQRLGEHVQLWWASQEFRSRTQVLEARVRQVVERVRK